MARRRKFDQVEGQLSLFNDLFQVFQDQQQQQEDSHEHDSGNQSSDRPGVSGRDSSDAAERGGDQLGARGDQSGARDAGSELRPGGAGADAADVAEGLRGGLSGGDPAGGRGVLGPDVDGGQAADGQQLESTGSSDFDGIENAGSDQRAVADAPAGGRKMEGDQPAAPGQGAGSDEVGRGADRADVDAGVRGDRGNGDPGSDGRSDGARERFDDHFRGAAADRGGSGSGSREGGSDERRGADGVRPPAESAMAEGAADQVAEGAAGTVSGGRAGVRGDAEFVVEGRSAGAESAGGSELRGAAGQDDGLLESAGGPEQRERSGLKLTFNPADKLQVSGGSKAKAQANIEALELLAALRQENRWPTHDEQVVLSGYSSWGGASEIFDRRRADWAPLRERLEATVSPATMRNLTETTLTAFFTGPEIVGPVWQALREAGYTSGAVLEPGSGTGNFIAQAPDTADMVGVEQDPISAEISQLLYPEATILNTGFEDVPAADNTFTAAIGNVPFGQFRLHDPVHNKGGHSIHDHFIIKSLDLVKPGGYVAVVTSAHTADKLRSEAREEMIERADLVSAVRLPNQAFRDAGTEVSADILIFRVREDGREPSKLSQQFLSTQRLDLDEENSVTVNSVFAYNPDAIMGTPGLRKDRFGKYVMSVANNTANFSEVLSNRLVSDIEQAKQDGLGLTADSAPAAALEGMLTAPATKTLPGTIVYDTDEKGQLSFRRYSGTTGQWSPVNVKQALHAEWKLLIDMRDTATQLRDAYRREATAAARTLQQQLGAQYDRYSATYGALNRFIPPQPKPPSQQQQNKIYNELVEEWRAANNLDKEDNPPAEVEEALRLQAAAPVVPDTRNQPHLGQLKRDPMIPSLLAFEDFDEKTQVGTKGALFFGDPSRQTPTIDHVDDIHDAVAISIDRHGLIDPSLVASLLGRTSDEVKRTLVDQQIAFRDPANPETFLQGAQYLSGVVADKLAEAEEAALTDDRFLVNVNALKEIQPAPITEGLVIRPGVHWLPQELYTRFLEQHIGISSKAFTITHSEDRWFIQVDKKRYTEGGRIDLDWGVVAANNRARGTISGPFNFQSSREEVRRERNQGLATIKNNGVAVNALKMFEAVLNLDTPTMNWSGAWQEAHPGISKVHPEATAFADRKVRAMQDAFTTWIESTPDVREQVYAIYNKVFNSRVAAKWDGAHRSMPGLGESFNPYPYQLSAVERMANEPSVLLNHAVGAGKTGTFLMGAAELKRLGKIRQPWIVVPNHLAEQVAEDALRWYPRANVLSGAGLKSPEQRREFIAQSTAQDWDFVIVPRSVFGLIAMSQEQQQAYAEARLDELSKQHIELLKSQGDKAPSVKQLSLLLKRQEEKIDELTSKPRDVGLEFESTHCDYLIVDEAHEFKNLQRSSSVDDLSHGGSQRASDMEMKLHYLRDTKAPGAPLVTFATGTPIANNLGELWVMAKYLRPDLLAETNTSTITAWAATFTEQSTDVEVKPTGTGLRSVSRSRGYINVGDLAGLCEPFLDTVTTDQINAALPADRKLPHLIGGKNQVTEFEVDQQTRDFMADFEPRMEKMAKDWNGHGNIPAQAFDNVAKMLVDGKKASLDPRLVRLDYEGYSPRVQAVTTNVMRVWNENRDVEYVDENTHQPHPTKGGLQIVFLDRSTPKADGSYNVYDQLKQSLVEQGMDPKRIAFVHAWDDKRSRLFEMCRNGEISVLIGSTEKLGTGANVQTRARALHHMDVPWRPADLEQREGRILRQGNQNDDVEIFNYIAKGTTDAVDWQTLYRKMKFINQFWQANRAMRQMESLDSSAEDAAALNKAIATGDSRYMDLVGLEREVDELTNLRAEWKANLDSTRLARINESAALDSLDHLLEWGQFHLDAAEKWANAQQDEKQATTWLAGGRETNERAQAARRTSEILYQIFDSRGQSRLNGSTILEIGGVGFEAEYHPADVSVVVRPSGLKLDGKFGTSFAHTRLEMRFRAMDLNFKSPDDPTKADKAQYGLLVRFENRIRDFAKIIEGAVDERVKSAARYEKLMAVAPTAFEHEERLTQATVERDTLRETLAKEDASAKAKQLREEREKRNEEHGREPGWSLRLNPTKTYAEVIEHASVEEVVAMAKRDEAEALYNHGLLTFDELTTRLGKYPVGQQDRDQADFEQGQALLGEIGQGLFSIDFGPGTIDSSSSEDEQRSNENESEDGYEAE